MTSPSPLSLSVDPSQSGSFGFGRVEDPTARAVNAFAQSTPSLGGSSFASEGSPSFLARRSPSTYSIDHIPVGPDSELVKAQDLARRKDQGLVDRLAHAERRTEELERELARQKLALTDRTRELEQLRAQMGTMRAAVTSAEQGFKGSVRQQKGTRPPKGSSASDAHAQAIANIAAFGQELLASLSREFGDRR